MTACVTNADPSLPLSDQDLYDYIEPNPDEGPALSECDGQQSSHVSCIKVFTKSLFLLLATCIRIYLFFKKSGKSKCRYLVLMHVCVCMCARVLVCVFQELEKVLNMSHQSRDTDSWREESG